MEYERRKKISSANVTRVLPHPIFQANEQEDYISTVDSGIKFLCACFVIRDAMPADPPEGEKTG